MKIKYIVEHISSLKQDISLIGAFLNANSSTSDRELYLANSTAFAREVERLEKLIAETDIPVELPLKRKDSK